jgi:hypothetical protein
MNWVKFCVSLFLLSSIFTLKSPQTIVGNFWGRVSMVCFSALKKCVNCNVGGFDIAIT